MPELPEVETVRRAMRRYLVGRQITKVRVGGKRLRQPMPSTRLRALQGIRFTAARRRAKYLLLALDDGQTLLIHLGMTGNLLFRPPGEKHDHVVFELDQGQPLVFSDPRRFGLVLLLRPGEEKTCPYLCRLGVEPLQASFNTAYLSASCHGRSRPIKNLLMDGNIVVGVGNIYASEALFRAGILPTATAGSLGSAACENLVLQVKAVLSQAIRQGGTTISDYQGSGEGGRFQQRLAVYGRQGQPCRTCRTLIANLSMAGRNTFYCPQCQS
jgi:formamidopyrimidine-DNA glycosylase